MKTRKMICHANRDQKKAGAAIHISDIKYFNIKTAIRDNRTQHKDQGINPRKYNNYICPDIGAPQYIRQMQETIKGEINCSTVILRNFSIPFTPVDTSFRQKVNKQTQDLNDTLNQLDLIDIFRAFQPNNGFHLFLKCTCHILLSGS